MVFGSLDQSEQNHENGGNNGSNGWIVEPDAY